MFKRYAKDLPEEVFNWRLGYAVLVFGLLGTARGLDEGLIGTTASQKSFSKQFGLKNPHLSANEQANLLSNITSMVQLGSIFGALFAFPITDRIGRLWAVRELCLVWVTGIAIFLGAAAHGSLGMVYAGRFIAGLGIGQTTVVAPTYLAEVAPKSIRGMCVGIFSGSVYLGIMLGYFASYGTSLHISNHNVLQWVIPNTLHLYFAAIIFTLSFFAIESPRWLIKTKQQGKAVDNLCRLRGLGQDHEVVQAEIIDINSQLEREQEATMGASKVGLLRELFVMPSNRYRIFLAIFAQLLGQWSGAGSITVYAPQYFALMGTTGTQEKLLATGIFGLVKFISALICAFFLVDFIGRKRSLSIGITIQFVAMLYMALFLTIDNTIGDKGDVQSASQKHAAQGAIAMIYFSGFGWAMGWNSIQYLINAEIFPLRLRAIGGSIAMAFHFVNQYGNSKAVPEMFVGMTTAGTMYFFAAITLAGLAWVYFFLPETSGRSLESLDAVFELPWHKIGRYGSKVAVSPTLYESEKDGMAEKNQQVEYLETSRQGA
ncbi:MFS quinate transporter [Aureobasidium sp. EXF-12298]|nr:MFS quinate transporter [Aureobasidium sp. EXF-12298]KAI4757825.1 MFS quinate transporter [Aureobasidium sp. EXF-12344]KAI4778213.1 MFS quinate transporter [Aureobasidium sp. EXF-3400]